MLTLFILVSLLAVSFLVGYHHGSTHRKLKEAQKKLSAHPRILNSCFTKIKIKNLRIPSKIPKTPHTPSTPSGSR